MLILVVAFAVSLVITLITVRSAKAHAHLSHDHDLSGPQKFHAMPVPRIGGFGILAGAVAGTAVLWLQDAPSGQQALLLLACGLPALLAGLAEDLTKKVSPSRRLLATALSALLAVWLLDAVIRRTAIPGLDWIVGLPVGAALVTIFAVAGVANSINIIDGFNGLASMCCVLILLCLAYVGFQVDDLLVTWHSLPTTIMQKMVAWGVPTSKAESEGYLHSWQLCGHLLGISDEYMPNSWHQANLQKRQVLTPKLAPTREGRLLADKLLRLGEQLDLTLLSKGILGAFTRYILGDKIADWIHVPREPVWSPLLEVSWPPYVALRSGIITVAPPMDNAYWLFDEFLRQFVLWYISELRMPISIELPQHNRTVF